MIYAALMPQENLTNWLSYAAMLPQNIEKLVFATSCRRKNSKHMIWGPKSPFSAISTTRHAEKFSLLGTDPQTPHTSILTLKNILP